MIFWTNLNDVKSNACIAINNQIVIEIRQEKIKTYCTMVPCHPIPLYHDRSASWIQARCKVCCTGT